MKTRCMFVLAAVSISSVAPVQADEALAKSKNCLSCHAMDAKNVGPAYLDIAKKYAGKKNAEARLSEKIIKGGKGSWTKELGAEIPMPPSTFVKDEEASILAKWILGLKRTRS